MKSEPLLVMVQISYSHIYLYSLKTVNKDEYIIGTTIAPSR
jgi:hypothetical protein